MIASCNQQKSKLEQENTNPSEKEISFMWNNLLIWAFIAFLARNPHDRFYDFVCVFLAIAFPMRVYDFVNNDRCLFLIDFCYWVNFSMVLYLQMDPQNAAMFKTIFLFSQGPVGVAHYWFR